MMARRDLVGELRGHLLSVGIVEYRDLPPMSICPHGWIQVSGRAGRSGSTGNRWPGTSASAKTRERMTTRAAPRSGPRTRAQSARRSAHDLGADLHMRPSP